jgi:peptide/nickel transport system substrate-binding protein
MYATDRPGYVKSILQGYGTLPNSWFDGTPYACPTMKKYDYNQETAKKLFDEAGLTEDKRKVMTITFMSWLGMKERQEFLPVAQENLRKLGFRVNVDIIDNALISDYKSGKTGRDWDFTVLATGPGMDPGNVLAFMKSDSSNNFGARGIPGWWVANKVQPGAWVYKNDKADQLLTQGQTEVDPAKRAAIYQQVDCIWNEDLPAIQFAFASDLMAKSTRVQGVDWQNWAGLGLITAPAQFRLADWWVWQK